MIKALLLWLLVASAAPGADVAPTTVPAIDQRIAELVAEVERGVGDVPVMLASSLRHADRSSLILVDARTQAERDVSIIAGAIALAQADRLTLSPELRVVVYCTIGLRSGHAARNLRKRGIDAVNLRGGVLAWLAQGGALVDPAGKPTHRVHVYGRRWNVVPDAFEAVW